MKKSNSKKTLISLSALALGLSISCVTVYTSGYSKSSASNSKTGITYIDDEMTIPLRSEKPPKFEVNSSGQTFGSIKDVESIEDMPLLIRAVGDHGIEGYIYKNDLLDVENEPASPEEAIRMQEEKEADPDFKRVINVYDSEGKKILDTLTSG